MRKLKVLAGCESSSAVRDAFIAMGHDAMTPAQFDAIAKLISLRNGPARDAARLVLVDGLRQADAMRQAGSSRDSVWACVRRVSVAAELCRVAAGH